MQPDALRTPTQPQQPLPSQRRRQLSRLPPIHLVPVRRRDLVATLPTFHPHRKMETEGRMEGHSPMEPTKTTHTPLSYPNLPNLNLDASFRMVTTLPKNEIQSYVRRPDASTADEAAGRPTWNWKPSFPMAPNRRKTDTLEGAASRTSHSRSTTQRNQATTKFTLTIAAVDRQLFLSPPNRPRPHALALPTRKWKHGTSLLKAMKRKIAKLNDQVTRIPDVTHLDQSSRNPGGLRRLTSRSGKKQ